MAGYYWRKKIEDFARAIEIIFKHSFKNESNNAILNAYCKLIEAYHQLLRNKCGSKKWMLIVFSRKFAFRIEI